MARPDAPYQHLISDAPGADAVPLALTWLYERHEEAMTIGFASTVFAGLRDEDVLALATGLPDNLVQMVEAFGRELLLAEGKIELDGVETACLDLVLGPGGPSFDAAQRGYLELLGRRSMSFYQVVESKPGTGFGVRDLLDDDEPVRWLAEPLLSQGLAAGEGAIFGARLMPGEPWRLSAGVVYPTQEPQASHLMGEIRKAIADETSPFDERRIRSMFVVFGWLFPLSRTPPGLFEELMDGMDQVC